MKETGHAAYEAWANVLGWRFRGIRLPDWGELTALEQDAWRAAAYAAFRTGWREDVCDTPGGSRLI